MIKSWKLKDIYISSICLGRYEIFMEYYNIPKAYSPNVHGIFFAVWESVPSKANSTWSSIFAFN